MKFNRKAEMRNLFLESVQPKPDEIWFSVEPSMDDIVICKWIGGDIEYLATMSRPYAQLSLKRAGRLVVAFVERNKQVPITVDTIGVGAGVYQYLLDKGYNVAAVNPASQHQPSKTPHTIG